VAAALAAAFIHSAAPFPALQPPLPSSAPSSLPPRLNPSPLLPPLHPPPHPIPLPTALWFRVTNPKDSGAPFPFEALLHTYLAVGHDNIGSVRVGGLRGLTYISKPEGGARKVQEEEALSIDREIDRVYVKAPDAVTVTGIAAGAAGAAAGGGAGGRRVTGVTCKSHATLRDAAPGLRQVVVKCPLDVVVWNPWIEVSAERRGRFPEPCALFLTF